MSSSGTNGDGSCMLCCCCHAACGSDLHIVNTRLDQLENAVATVSSKLRTVIEDLEGLAEDLFLRGIDVLEQRVEKMEILLMRTSIEQIWTRDKGILIHSPQCVPHQSCIVGQSDAEQFPNELSDVFENTDGRTTSTVTSPECLRTCACESERELEDELRFMLLIGALDSKSEICEQLFSSGSNHKIWDDYIYPTIAKQIEEALQRPPTELLNTEVEERYSGMMQSELWRNVCDAVPCIRRHSDAFLEISYAAFKFHERILQSRT